MEVWMLKFFLIVAGICYLCVFPVSAVEFNVHPRDAVSGYNEYRLVEKDGKVRFERPELWDNVDVPYEITGSKNQDIPVLRALPPDYEGNPLGVPVESPGFLFFIIIFIFYIVFKKVLRVKIFCS
jgi:hypothetical protein